MESSLYVLKIWAKIHFDFVIHPVHFLINLSVNKVCLSFVQKLCCFSYLSVTCGRNNERTRSGRRATVRCLCREMEVTHSFVRCIWEKEEKWGLEKCGWPFPALSWCVHTEQRRETSLTEECRDDAFFFISNAAHVQFWDKVGDFYLKTMSRGSKSKVESSRSSLLSLQENEKLEDLLGRRCAVSSDRGAGRTLRGRISCCTRSDLRPFGAEELIRKVKGDRACLR